MFLIILKSKFIGKTIVHKPQARLLPFKEFTPYSAGI